MRFNQQLLIQLNSFICIFILFQHIYLSLINKISMDNRRLSNHIGSYGNLFRKEYRIETARNSKQIPFKDEKNKSMGTSPNKDENNINLIPMRPRMITQQNKQFVKDNPKAMRISTQNFTKDLYQNKIQNLDWLTHTFICLSSSENTARKKIQKIHEIIKINDKYFTKAIIYAETAYTSRQIYNYFDNKFRKDVKIINSSHNQQQTRNIYEQYILPQFKILITTHQPNQLNEEGMIDIEDVNLIIFQALPTNPSDYRSRLIRSPKLNEGARGIAISFASQTYSYTLYKYIPNVEQHQKNLNIKFEEFKGNVSPFIKKGIQKINQVLKKDHILKKQMKKQSLLQKDQVKQKKNDKNKNKGKINNQDVDERPNSQRINLISIMERQGEGQDLFNQDRAKKSGIKLSKVISQEIVKQKKKEKKNDQTLIEEDISKTRIAVKKSEVNNSKHIRTDSIQTEKDIYGNLKFSRKVNQQGQQFFQKLQQIQEKGEKQELNLQKYLIANDQMKKSNEEVKQISQKNAQKIQKQIKNLEETLTKQFIEIKGQIKKNKKKIIETEEKLTQKLDQNSKKRKNDNQSLQKLQFANQFSKIQIKMTKMIDQGIPKNLLQKLITMTQQNKSTNNSLMKIIQKMSTKLNEIEKSNNKLTQQLNQKKLNQRFLSQSQIYEELNQKRKELLYQSIKNTIKKDIKKTKTLFEGKKTNDFTNWLEKIQGRTNLLMLMVIQNHQILACFTQDYFSTKPDETEKKGDAFILNLTNSRIFPLKPNKKGKALKNNDHYFILGDNQLFIKPNLSFQAITSRIYCHFQTSEVSFEEFFGLKEQKGNYRFIEFHQIFTQ